MTQPNEQSTTNSRPACAGAVLDILRAMAVPGLGPIGIRRLIETFGCWDNIVGAPVEALREQGIRADAIRAIRSATRTFDPEAEYDKAQVLGIAMVPFTAEVYPQALKVQPGSPPLLFVRGRLLERDAVAIGIVGTRRASLYGRMQAERLAFELASAGFTVVSGLARGIDAAAHRAALKAGGRTLAVLGNGLASVYPPEHAKLAEEIAANGALLCELLPETAPSAANFPPRNRLIAGLSLGVVVVEAGRRSGALITAREAGEMGKEVFAVPGDVTRPQTRGSHQLIRDGAKLVEAVNDILEELGPLTQPVRLDTERTPLADPRAMTLNRNERHIYDILDTTPQDIDTITRESRLSPANVASTLMVLELKHLAVQIPGKRYVRGGTFEREPG